MARIAVLTGDLVRSRQLSDAELETAFAALAASAAQIARWAGGPLHLTRNRGDGWQAILTRPTLDLRAALTLCAALAALGPGFGTRIALARGAGQLDGPDLNRAQGPAFIAAGQTLDTMADPCRLTHAGRGALGAATRLADVLAQGWTRSQARAIGFALAPTPPKQAEIAQALGITQQAVSKSLDAAHYDALSTALALIEEDDA